MTITKKQYSGEYKVYTDGLFAGIITRNGSLNNEWVAFDSANEWLSTTKTKWEALTNF